ncbi:MAG: DUF3307 domain-containing protein [Roseiarcus sp.]
MPQPGLFVPFWPFCALLLAMAVKHFVADFLLQTNWIARGKERPTGWAAPLAVHALIHGGCTLLIALAVAPRLWWLGPADLAIHWTIDRAKTLVSLRGGWSADQAAFWWVIGFDQLLHQATNIALAAAFFVL